jgi:hypothetical protein
VVLVASITVRRQVVVLYHGHYISCPSPLYRVLSVKREEGFCQDSCVKMVVKGMEGKGGVIDPLLQHICRRGYSKPSLF